jgi:hypothetical protein
MQRAEKKEGSEVASNNFNFEYFIDYLKRKVHLLNVESNSYKKLSNIIDPEFQKNFIKTENLLLDLMDFDWILYESTGIIIIYKNYSIAIVSPKLPYLHKPFLEKLN